MTTDEAIQKKLRFHQFNLPWYPFEVKDKRHRLIRDATTRVILAELFGELGFTAGVEVGVKRGEFSKILCQKNPALKLTCVDPWMAYDNASQERQDRYFEYAQANLKEFHASFLRLPSLEAVTRFEDRTLDFVYIDGNHAFDHIMRDLIEWAPKVRKGGILAAHDYHTEVGADVMAAVNAYTHCHDIRPWYVTRELLPSAFWVSK